MRDLIGILGSALLAAVILAVICLLLGRKIAHACSERLAFFGIVAVIALLTLIAVLNQIAILALLALIAALGQ